MTMTTNTENLQQYKSRFSLIVEQILVFTSSTNFERRQLDNDVLRYR